MDHLESTLRDEVLFAEGKADALRIGPSRRNCGPRRSVT
jgi:hypothetical protein